MLRDQLKSEPEKFQCLDAAQLVKHAFAIRTESAKERREGILCYLYAEPALWPDGRPIDSAINNAHRDEIETFKALTLGAEVRFATWSYRELLATMKSSPHSEVRRHGTELELKYPHL
jgi:hypothetical protein